MKHFGIIGWPVAHSQSAVHFNEKFRTEHIDAEYSLYPLQAITDFPALVQGHTFAGLNVTIPYKQAILPYLDELDASASSVGAVNVIRFCHSENGTHLVGYNTDAIGFRESIRPRLLPADRYAVVLGTGGAAKACHYGLASLGINVIYVSRNGQPLTDSLPNAPVSYADLPRLWEMIAPSVVVNATPCGMTPDVDGCPPFPMDLLHGNELLFDCIYTPAETVFLREGRTRGCRTCNGQGMLLGQAIAAWQIWNQ